MEKNEMQKRMNKMKIDGRIINVSKADKIIFPVTMITKWDLIQYYSKISPYMLSYMKNRPLALQRFPEGIQKEGFYQKNASDYYPDWIKTFRVKKEGGWVDHVLCNDKETLIYLVNQGVITFHLWLSTTDKLRFPDKLVFDLDPTEEDFDKVIKGAQVLKRVLENDLGFKTYVMTTGSKGLHIIAPLIPNQDYDEVHDFAKKVANYIVIKHPSEFTVTIKKDQRKGRLFIDYLRNSYAQLVVAPFSVRALEGAPVATPISWQELKEGKISTSKAFNIHSVFKRLEQKDHPWKGFNTHTKSINDPKSKLEALINAQKSTSTHDN